MTILIKTFSDGSICQCYSKDTSYANRLPERPQSWIHTVTQHGRHPCPWYLLNMHQSTSLPLRLCWTTLCWPLTLPVLSAWSTQHRCTQSGRWAANWQCGSMALDSGSPWFQSPLLLQESSNIQFSNHNSKSAPAGAETLGWGIKGN